MSQELSGSWNFRFTGGPCDGCYGCFPFTLNTCFCAHCNAVSGKVDVMESGLTMTPMWFGCKQGGFPAPCPCCNICCFYPFTFKFKFEKRNNALYVGNGSVYESGINCCPPMTTNKGDKFVFDADNKNISWVASDNSCKYPCGMKNQILGQAKKNDLPVTPNSIERE